MTNIIAEKREKSDVAHAHCEFQIVAEKFLLKHSNDDFKFIFNFLDVSD